MAETNDAGGLQPAARRTVFGILPMENVVKMKLPSHKLAEVAKGTRKSLLVTLKLSPEALRQHALETRSEEHYCMRCARTLWYMPNMADEGHDVSK
jgi:hypothetical protein